MKKRSFVTLDTFSDDLIQYKGSWLMMCKVQSIDIEMRSTDEKESIMYLFKQILASFNTSVQVIHKKFPLDFSSNILSIKSNVALSTNNEFREYGQGYLDYLNGVVVGKLDRVNYLIIRTDSRCSYESAKPYLEGVKSQLQRSLGSINMNVMQLTGNELKAAYSFPKFIKEETDYAIYGNEFRRYYVIKDYPRRGSPNWLMPLLGFPYPIELIQHYHPFQKDKVIDALELSISKLQSTINLQIASGLTVSTDLVVRKDDAIDLLNRLSSGDESIIETGFYVAISAESLDKLNVISYHVETVMRQLGLAFRRTVKDTNQAITSCMPLCQDEFMPENYTFDAKSLSTLIPFTSQDYTSGGIVYGINEELEEIISLDVFAMPNPNKIILGKSGFGKSTLAKLEIPRHMVSGTQAIVIDHNYEYAGLCEKLGGQYVEEGQRPDWNRNLIVFGGDKTSALITVWEHVQKSPLRQRLLVIEEVHNIFSKEKQLMLTIIREIRKLYTSPTLITQNIKEFLRSDEGQMIMDICSIKIFMRQGENDMEEVERLFGFSKQEKMYLKTCKVGHGYLVTDLFKTKFKVDYSPKEALTITTNPRDKTSIGVIL